MERLNKVIMYTYRIKYKLNVYGIFIALLNSESNKTNPHSLFNAICALV